MIERPDLADHPDYATMAGRKAHEETLQAIIEPWTVERPPEEAAQLLQGAGVPAAPVNNFEQLLKRDPQLRERQVWREVEHPELGHTIVEDWGFKLSEAPPVTRRAPLLGEHNDYVFQEVIGMDEDEVNTLLVEGVLR